MTQNQRNPFDHTAGSLAKPDRMTENRRAAYATLEQRLNCSYRTLYAGIFVIALATLLFEVSLIRVFSFTI